MLFKLNPPVNKQKSNTNRYQTFGDRKHENTTLEISLPNNEEMGFTVEKSLFIKEFKSTIVGKINNKYKSSLQPQDIVILCDGKEIKNTQLFLV